LVLVGKAGILLAVMVVGGCLVAAAPPPHGDPARGAEVYASFCGSCHSLDANRVGPAHRGVYGRKAGLAPGFTYSSAIQNSAIVWNEQTLDRWLQNPQAMIAGTTMGFRLTNEQQRADVIAFLKHESQTVR
jgi:cytochrome c